jgi:hypothetical protein
MSRRCISFGRASGEGGGGFAVAETLGALAQATNKLDQTKQRRVAMLTVTSSE